MLLSPREPPKAVRPSASCSQQQLRKQEATAVIEDNLNSKASPDNDVAEDSSRSRGEQEATHTIGSNPADQALPDKAVTEGVSRAAVDLSKSHEEQEATHTIGENSFSQAPNVVNAGVANDGEVTNDAPTGDANGQAALLLVAGSLPSIRSPSSTLVWLMAVQAQFLAVLSLVDSVGSESSWLSNFLENLR